MIEFLLSVIILIIAIIEYLLYGRHLKIWNLNIKGYQPHRLMGFSSLPLYR